MCAHILMVTGIIFALLPLTSFHPASQPLHSHRIVTMAKGLRASSKVKARNARRYTPGSDYEVTHAARLHAISQRLMSRVKGKRSADADEDEGKQANGQQATVKVDDKQGAATAEDGKGR